MDGISQMWEDEIFRNSQPPYGGWKSLMKAVPPLFREAWKKEETFWDLKNQFPSSEIWFFLPEMHIQGAAEFLRAAKEKGWVNDFFTVSLSNPDVCALLFSAV